MADAGPGPQEEGQATILECAICFDQVEESTALPCSCRITYCSRCWDRALAQSFKSCGQARCPSCRSPVRVDFDPEAAGGQGRLVFSRETQAGATLLEATQRAEARAETIERLAAQARPVQVRLLERYGTAHPALGEAARDPQQALGALGAAALKRLLAAAGGSAGGCLEKADLVARLSAAAGGGGRGLCSLWAQQAASTGELPAPACVCGGALERLGGHARARAYVESLGLAPDSQHFARVLADVTRNGCCGIICDLCDNEEIPLDSAVWTCGRGDKTILHATSYDVCEACFLRHVLGPEGAPAEDRPGSADAA